MTPRRRRWLAAVAALILLLALAWGLFERAIQVEQYRPAIEKQIAELTGLPVTIAELDLAWRPVPCFSALGVSIGDGDFRATAARIDVYPAVHRLLWRELEIPWISLDAVVLTLPPSVGDARRAWEETWSRIEAGLEAEGTSSPGLVESVAIAKVRAGRAQLRLGAGAAPILTANLTFDGVMSDALAIEVEAELAGEGGRAEGELHVPLVDAPGEALRGRFALERLRPDTLVALPALAHATWNGTLDVAGADPDGVSLQVAGAVVPDASSAFEGRFGLRARVGGGSSARVEGELSGDGWSLEAGLGETDTLQVAALEVRGAALDALLAPLRSGSLRLDGSDAARIRASGLVFELAPGASPRPLAGSVEIRGLALANEGGVLMADLGASGTVADGALAIGSLGAGPLSLRGRVVPGPDGGHALLDLSGELQLKDAWLRVLGVPELVREVEGRVAITEVSGAVPPATGRAPLLVRAHTAGASLRIVSEAIEDTLARIELTLGAQDEELSLSGSAHSDVLGEIALDARLDPAAKRGHGQLTLDLGALAGHLADPDARARVAPVLASFGRSSLDIALERAPGDAESWRLSLSHAAEPAIESVLMLHPRSDAGLLGAVEATFSDVPAEALRGLVPETVRLSGTGRLTLERPAGGGPFRVDVDLRALGFASGDFVEKKPGEALSLRSARSGNRDPTGWLPTRFALVSEQGELEFGIEEGALVAPDLDVDLADWSYLLVDSATASGRVRGALDAREPTADLRLDAVRIHLSPDSTVDRMDGEVALRPDGFGVRGLRIRGAGSDATLDATLDGGRLEGGLSGANLDVDFVRALLGEIEAWTADAEPAPREPLSGTFSIRLDRVGYGRSEGRNLVANATLREGDVSVRDLSLETYEGRVSGSVLVDARAGEASLLRLDLELLGVGGRFLDDMLSEEPRGFRGSFDGRLQFRGPLRDDARAMLADAGGSLTVTGHDGSFGRLGMATKLAAVLRSTEVLRLKLPPLHDAGLVFDTTSARLTMEQGVLDMHAFRLDSTSYAIDASGQLDFRKEESRVPIEVNALKGLTGVVDRIPVAGDALRLVSVRLLASGSPYDLKVRVASVKDQLLGIGEVGPQTVTRGVGEVLRWLRRGDRTSPGDAPPRTEEVPLDAQPSADRPGDPKPDPPGAQEPPG